MGDWFETVVDTRVDEAAAPAVADRVVAALIAAGLVEPERTDCTLGGSGYPPASGIQRLLKAPDPLLMQLKTNGLDVKVGRSAHLGVNVERIACPTCASATGDLEGVGWQDAVGEWYQGRDGAISCPGCRHRSTVAAWAHEPACGFGNLAFTFWNWPPFETACWIQTPAQLVEAVIGHPCVLVRGKL